MNENFITIENVAETELGSILLDLANLYVETDFVQGMRYFKNNADSRSFLIKFTFDPDFERFNYFVNYLRYPMGYENISPKVRGYYKTVRIDFKADFKVGDFIMVYVSNTDTEYDNVSLTINMNESYIYDFGGKIKKLDQTDEFYDYKPLNMNDYEHIADVYPSEEAKKKASKPWWKFW